MINFNRDILNDLVKNKITIDQVKFGKIKIGEPIEAIDILDKSKYKIREFKGEKD